MATKSGKSAPRVSAPKRSTNSSGASAPSPSPSPSSDTSVDRDQVARRAYERFVERGGMHGHDLEDWLAAEDELAGRN